MVYNLLSIEQDDTFPGVSFEFNFSLSGLIIELKIYYKGTKKVVAIYTLKDNLEVNPSNNKLLTLKPHDLTFGAGSYHYTLKMNPFGFRQTCLEGDWIIT